MAAGLRPANRPATETTPELARTGHCIGFKCECKKLVDPRIVKDWESCGGCGHTSFSHEWEPVAT